MKRFGMGRCILTGTLVTLMMSVLPCLAAPAAPTYFLQDGNGYWWDINGNGSVDDGRSEVQDPDSVDAFDAAMRLSVDGAAFPISTQTTEMSGHVVVTGPETLAGLSVTRRLYVPDGQGDGFACFMEYLQNPTGGDITVTVRVWGNLGSDGFTTVMATSSGDTVFAPEDRWVCSDDHNSSPYAFPELDYPGNPDSLTPNGFDDDGDGVIDDGPADPAGRPEVDTTNGIDDDADGVIDDKEINDPSLSFNYWGAGAAVTPNAVLLPASQDDYYVDFPGVVVPAGKRVVLMHFCGQHVDDAAALVNAQALDSLPSQALVALFANYSPLVNWKLPEGLAVTPTDTLAASGLELGPFTPDTRQYMVLNTEITPIDWEVTAPAWITVDPVTGPPLGPSESQPVDITINAEANLLTPGVYSVQVVFSNMTSGVSTARDVVLTVAEWLELTELDGFSTEGLQGGPFVPASRTYTLTNAGPDPVTWSAVPPAWLTAVPEDSTAAGGPLASLASVVVTVSTNSATEALALGTFNDDLTFNNMTRNTAQTRDMEVVVNERLSVTPTGRFVSRGLVGGPFTPTATNYTLTNTGGTSIDWTVTGPSWLDLTPVLNGNLAGGASIVITATVNTTANGMALGDYLDVVTFENVTYAGSTFTRDVLLRVSSVIHVDIDDLTPGDGSSWDAALNSIQEGITVADQTNAMVWVADGEYLETLTMADGVDVFGGFNGTETALEPRDIEANLTIINAGGVGSAVTFSTAAKANSITNCGLEGFVITGGNGPAGGGGILFDAADNTTFVNLCTIRNNVAANRGGGIYCLNDAAPLIINCEVIGNEILDVVGRDFGGGICCYQAAPTIMDSLVCGNEGRHGGGIGLIESSPTILNCIISGNEASFSIIDSQTGEPYGAGGGGVFANAGSNPVITNCVISGNYTQNWGAAGLYCQSSSPVVTNCTFSSNRSYSTLDTEIQSGVVVNDGSMPVLTNCIFEGMTKYAIYEENAGDESDVTVSNCLFHNNGIADFHMYDSGIGTADYTGGDEIDANLARANDNVPGNPDPYYTVGPSGVWASPPAYDTPTNLTTLTAVDGSAFTAGALDGMLINADISQTRQALIFSNTADTVVVVGDITGYAGAGDTFRVLNYLLAADSLGVDAGTNIAPNIYSPDLAGGARTVGGTIDLGPYETSDFLAFTTHPIDANVLIGDSYTFTVVAENGTGTLHYRWLRDGVPIPGPDSSVFSIVGVTAQDGGVYTCEVTDDFVTVSSITVTLVTAPVLSIVTQPVSATVTDGDSHTFIVSATGGFPPLSYAWKRDGTAIQGATSDLYTIGAVTSGDEGAYTVEVADAYVNAVESFPEAILTVVGGVPLAGGVGLSILAGACLTVGIRRLRKRDRE